MSQRVAVFDMDRTLVQKNTAQLYTRYRRDLGEIGLLGSVRVAYWVVLYTLGIVHAQDVAKKALREYRGMPEEELARRCADWFPRYVKQWVSAGARQAVSEHRARGDLLVIATGSTFYASSPLAEELGGLEIVCSELQVDAGGRLTGEVREPLCFGQGKVERLKTFLLRHDTSLAECTFYSDSITDLPLLNAVGAPRVVNPDFRLKRLASRRSWPILSW